MPKTLSISGAKLKFSTFSVITKRLTCLFILKDGTKYMMKSSILTHKDWRLIISSPKEKTYLGTG